MANKNQHCSFCGKPKEETHRLITGPDGACICDECVEICKSMVEEWENEKQDSPEIPLKKPAEIKAELDKYIVGQDKAKRVLSVAVYNHYKRINATVKQKKNDDEVEIEKSNVLLLGPTGSGKTLLARTLAKILNVPFATSDATTLTEAGYVGEDVENILLKLIQNADFNIERAQRGIIYIDEIDKICKRGESSGPDVSREGVQRDLLPLVEGCTVSTKHGMVKTDHILFIASGAFQIAKPSDLIPELQGRLPIRVELQALTTSDFERILTEPKNSLVKQYEKLFDMDGVKLTFDKKALEYIEVIDRQSQRLKKLTVDIVEASKAATGNIEVHPESTVLNVILLQTNGEYIERLEEKSLTLVSEIPDKKITISTDGRLLWRVIDNLMNNICKYSMPGTRVYLTLWENNGRAFISFRNISRNKLNITPENLTERFVRGDSSRNTEGSGLGLSIANSLTEIMGGKLSIIIDGDLFKVTLSFPTIETEQ